MRADNLAHMRKRQLRRRHAGQLAVAHHQEHARPGADVIRTHDGTRLHDDDFETIADSSARNLLRLPLGALVIDGGFFSKARRCFRDFARHRTISGNGRGDDQTPHAFRLRGLDDIARALNIVTRLLGIMLAPHAGIAGHMEQRISALRNGSNQRRTIGDLTDSKTRTETTEERQIG